MRMAVALSFEGGLGGLFRVSKMATAYNPEALILRGRILRPKTMEYEVVVLF